ncbi:hypothetical protein OGAPHI_000665 [Ogataea philodendri]|uniref:Uncharacterized protein n=1 Tax=Ogataea philodendri TaxID=1378263 RepID=A0A9P8T9U9_9ASCO|nr:uncharacterized protein OGAPHI_000665 [Ogataea philodendri]KAH3670954.1 hypothetical protein OGAPHI_000665 [Ogataea philodendri]
MRRRSNSAESEDLDHLAESSDLHLYFDNKTIPDSIDENEFIDMVLNKKSDRNQESAFGRALKARELSANENQNSMLDFQTPMTDSVASSTPRADLRQNIASISKHYTNVLNPRNSPASEANQVQKLVVKFDDNVQDKENLTSPNRLRTLQSEKRELQEKLEQANVQNATMEQELELRLKTINDLERKIESLMDSRSVIQKELDSFKEMVLAREQLEQEISKLKSSNEELVAENNKLKADVEEQSDKVARAETKNAELEAQVTEQTGTITQLKADADSAQSVGAKLESVCHELENTKLELQKVHEASRSHESTNQSLTQELELERQKLAEVEKGKFEVEKLYESLKTQTEKEIDQIMTKMKDSEGSTDELMAEKQRLASKMTEYEYLIESLKQENESHKAKIGDVSTKLSSKDLKNYQMLQLDDVDALTLVELSNVMKQILTLFGIRVHNIRPFFKFISRSYDYYEQFATHLHATFYNEEPMNPQLLISNNLQRYKGAHLKKLKHCLQSMLNTADRITDQ